MKLYLDEMLSPKAARSLHQLDYEISAHGLNHGLARGGKVSDREVVDWCLDHGAVLVTCDRGRHSREMVEILRVTRQPVVFVYPPSPPAKDLARALINEWGKIAALHTQAARAGKQTVIRLEVKGRGRATKHRHSPI